MPGLRRAYYGWTLIESSIASEGLQSLTEMTDDNAELFRNLYCDFEFD